VTIPVFWAKLKQSQFGEFGVRSSVSSGPSIIRPAAQTEPKAFTWIAPYSNANHNASPAKGMAVSFATITDGLSNTMFCSELITGKGIDVRGMTWWGDSAGFTANLPPNSKLFDLIYSTSACEYPGNNNPPCKVATIKATASTATVPSLYMSARSRHSGGVNALMGDGSVKFIKNTISVPTWRALSTSQGGEIISADAF